MASVVRESSDSSAPLPASPATALTPLPADQSSVGQLEVIGGFRVHPAASFLPLLTGKGFEEMVESIGHTGVAVPVELHDGLLIDGRNRVRAVEELRARGVELHLPTKEWQPVGDETVEEHIWTVNIPRRHMTDDQLAVAALQYLPGIRRSRAERQAATRFGNKPPVSAAQGTTPPAAAAAGKPRSSQEKDAASTVGQIAAFANVSRYKASQAVAIADGVASGEIAAADLQDVVAGNKRLRDVVRSTKPAAAKKTRPRSSERPAVELMFDSVPDASTVNEEEVRRRWETFKRPFAIADHRELRRLVKKLITEEQQEFDK